MSLLSRLSSLARNLLHKDRVDADLDEEIRSYASLATDEKRRAGLGAEEARRAALVELGGIEQVKEAVREVRQGALADQLRQDLSYAVRMLAKSPGFSAVVVATLALGLGANTAIFSVVDAVVFRSLPYQDPERLVKICGNARAVATDDVSLPDLLDIREESHSFEQVAADDGSGVTITHADGTREPVDAALVTGSWLTTLGVRPMLGRAFLPEDERPGHDRVMILTHAYWRRRFDSDPAIVGKTLAVGRDPVTVVAVLPPNVLRYGADILVPLVPADYPPGRDYRDLDAFARLRPGVTLRQAQAELDTIARRLAAEYPATNKTRRFSLVPLEKWYAEIEPKAGNGLLLMLGAVGLVLLIACVNVASLLLARGVTRYRECVIRAALGASRARLVRQLLVEHVLLFLAGGTLGVLLARSIVGVLVALAVTEGYVPERLAIGVDGRVLAFSLLVSVLSGLSFGLAPALQASRVDPVDGLKDGGQASSGGLDKSRARRLLIVSELALSLVLLVGSGLMMRSFFNLQATSAGFDPENLLETSSEGGREFPAARAFWRATIERARMLPGVEQAAVTSRPPVHDVRELHFDVEGHPDAFTDARPRAGDILVSPDYFRTLGIPLLKGRAFSEKDDGAAPAAAIVSESLARRFFANGDALGRRVRFAERSPRCCAEAVPTDGIWLEIVGVVEDVRQLDLDQGPALTLYRPYSQIVEHDMVLMVRARSAADTARVAAQLLPHLRAVDGSRDWSVVRSMRQVMGAAQSIRLRRFVLILLASLAGLALLLAAVGVYGVMAYSVAERTREIGIRLALGATRQVVRRQVLAEAMGLALAGLFVGGLAALGLTRFIESLLFGVRPADAVTYLGVSLVLVGAALLASYLPARRAMRVDPMAALRHN
jgi:putative ABC transport system permease protein